MTLRRWHNGTASACRADFREFDSHPPLSNEVRKWSAQIVDLEPPLDNYAGYSDLKEIPLAFSIIPFLFSGIFSLSAIFI